MILIGFIIFIKQIQAFWKNLKDTSKENKTEIFVYYGFQRFYKFQSLTSEFKPDNGFETVDFDFKTDGFILVKR